MARYFHQLKAWPDFTWDNELLLMLLAEVRNRQGRLLGKMETLGFELRDEAFLHTMTLDVLKSSEIEGEKFNSDEVRSSVARKLGMDVAGLVNSGRDVDGVVEVLADATNKSNEPLTKERLCKWHAWLFPSENNTGFQLTVGEFRKGDKGPMQVVSGPLGFERVHYEAPESSRLEDKMNLFLDWFNSPNTIDPVLKAALAHLWFVSVHPFDDGNGRLARAVADMQLSRADGLSQRFYSMSAQILVERKEYYKLLELTQKGDLDVTSWMLWFLECLKRTLESTEYVLKKVLFKAKFWDCHKKTVLNSRQVEMLNKLLDNFDGKLTSSKWAKMQKCSQDTALRDIQDLLTKNVLLKDVSGGRSTAYELNNQCS